MTKILKSVVLIALVVASQSCTKEVVNRTPAPVDKVQDLKVPADFDWVTSKSVSCVVNSVAPAAVEVYTDEGCSDGLLASFTAPAGSTTLHLSTAKSTDKLYLKYKDATNADKVLTSNLDSNAASFEVTDGVTAQNARLRGADDMPVFDGGGFISYPAGWGTVMFEDLFPDKGDYDFNDFVASYQIAVEFPWDAENGRYNTARAHQIRLHLRLRAIGGSTKFIPYIRVKGLDKSNVTIPEHPYGDVSYANPKILNNTLDGVEVALVDSEQTSDVIVEFKNLNDKNPYKVTGEGISFFNTTRGNVMNVNKLTEVVVYLELKEEVDAKSLLDDNIDIFIATAAKDKEIHVRGFEPVFAPYDYTQEKLDATVPYTSSSNLVWGIKVAKVIPHAYEKVDFCEAYSDFASWAQSGGATNNNWYETNTVKGNLVEWPK